MQSVTFVLLGYLSGSVLYACIFAKIFKKEDMIENSKDKNPGSANAFMYGGFLCGLFTLICDVLKGFIPVFLYIAYCNYREIGASLIYLVMAAPVVGHAFPVFHKFKGGKGIATTFGCLLGLFPSLRPFLTLVAFFIFFSGILRITPHFDRTLITYFVSAVSIFRREDSVAIIIGFMIITAVVFFRMFSSKEEKEKMKVNILWKH